MAGALLGDLPPDAPSLALQRRSTTDAGPSEGRLKGDHLTLPLRTGGWVELARAPLEATFHLPAQPDDATLIHPYLAPVAALAARWLDRESFHAGAVVLDGGAWAVVGDKGAGKSSTLAHLALAGHSVLTDDMLIVAGGEALAGPRCIDLRAEPARRFGTGSPLGVVGQRERWRMPLGPAPPRVPLRGWILLEWDEQVVVRPVEGADRLVALAPQRAVSLPPRDPAVLLELSALPVLRLCRPQRWDALPEAAERLLDAIAG